MKLKLTLGLLMGFLPLYNSYSLAKTETPEVVKLREPSIEDCSNTKCYTIKNGSVYVKDKNGSISNYKKLNETFTSKQFDNVLVFKNMLFLAESCKGCFGYRNFALWNEQSSDESDQLIYIKTPYAEVPNLIRTDGHFIFFRGKGSLAESWLAFQLNKDLVNYRNLWIYDGMLPITYNKIGKKSIVENLLYAPISGSLLNTGSRMQVEGIMYKMNSSYYFSTHGIERNTFILNRNKQNKFAKMSIQLKTEEQMSVDSSKQNEFRFPTLEACSSKMCFKVHQNSIFTKLKDDTDDKYIKMENNLTDTPIHRVLTFNGILFVYDLNNKLYIYHNNQFIEVKGSEKANRELGVNANYDDIDLCTNDIKLYLCNLKVYFIGNAIESIIASYMGEPLEIDNSSSSRPSINFTSIFTKDLN